MKAIAIKIGEWLLAILIFGAAIFGTLRGIEGYQRQQIRVECAAIPKAQRSPVCKDYLP